MPKREGKETKRSKPCWRQRSIEPLHAATPSIQRSQEVREVIGERLRVFRLRSASTELAIPSATESVAFSIGCLPAPTLLITRPVMTKGVLASTAARKPAPLVGNFSALRDPTCNGPAIWAIGDPIIVGQVGLTRTRRPTAKFARLKPPSKLPVFTTGPLTVTLALEPKQPLEMPVFTAGRLTGRQVRGPNSRSILI